MQKIKLSIIVTFCNQKQFIKQCLDSIFAQKTNFLFEVLIGLDGENDGSKHEISKYKEKHNNIFIYTAKSYHKLIPLSKASLNRINLVRHARGEYITFLDGDDFYINENRFNLSLNFLDANYDFIGFAHAHQKYDDKAKKFTSVISPFPSNKKISLETIIDTGKYLFSNDIVFRNIFLYNNIDFVSDLYLNDSTLTFWILTHGDIYFTPVPMLGYRTNINSIYGSKTFIEKKINELIINEENYFFFNTKKIFFKRKILNIVKQILENYKNSNFDFLENYEFQIYKRNLKISKNIIYLLKSNKNYTYIRLKLFILIYFL